MKFSPVLLLLGVRLTVPARPDVGTNVGSSTFSSRPGSKYCYYDRNKRKIQVACGIPGNNSIETIEDVGWTGSLGASKHVCPNVPCCAPSAGMKDNRCLCAHYGERYDQLSRFTYRGSCCSYNGNRNLKCGCGLVGEPLRWGGKDSDCCSGSYDGTHCTKRKCTVGGGQNSPHTPCCRWVKDGQYSGAVVDGLCGCIHSGDSPAEEVDEVDARSCCSKMKTGGVCSCIDDTQSPLTAGAVKSDCCSKTTVENDGKTYCKADKCLGLGMKPSGGAVCCSEVEKDGACGCLAPGKKIPDAGAAKTCCSGRADHDDAETCGHMHVGEFINKTMMDATVCFSGKVDEHGACACIHDGEVSAEASQCCAGWHSKNDKKCGCAITDAPLIHGAKPSDCCSKAADNGHCLCSHAGRPSRVQGKDCCSESAKDGFCGCFGHEDNITKSEAVQCCGGFYNESDTACKCVPAGTAVASFVHDGACCGDGVVVAGRCKPGGK